MSTSFRLLHRATICAASVVACVLCLSCGRGTERRRPSTPNPLTTLPAEDKTAGPIVGRVVQRLKVSSYTYLEVEAPSGARQWVVMLGAGPEEGARVRVRSMGRRKNFASPRLGRSFPDLVFGIVSRDL